MLVLRYDLRLRVGSVHSSWMYLGLDKKLAAHELARARGGSARLGSACYPNEPSPSHTVGSFCEPSRVELARKPLVSQTKPWTVGMPGPKVQHSSISPFICRQCVCAYFCSINLLHCLFNAELYRHIAGLGDEDCKVVASLRLPGVSLSYVL